MLRFKTRHVAATLVDYVRDQLTELGWVNPPVNFGTAPIIFQDMTPDEAGVPIAPNTVCVTLGDEPANTEEELGGALLSIAYPLFVDVYGTKQSIAVSIACDVKAILFSKAIPLYNYAAEPRVKVDGAYIEFEEVEGPMRPPVSLAAGADDFRRYWRVVRAEAVTYLGA